MDIDFGDLDAPSKAPAPKAGKFAPKNSKFKPVAKPKTEPEPSEIKPITVPKVELDDDTPMPPSKPEIDPPVHSETNGNETNGSVKNDTDDMELDDNQEEEEEEDKVVREIDVFFTSNHANSKLYVLQYPLRPHWRPYELDDRCSEVRVKPKTAEMELDMSVQADSENFDTDVDLDKVMRKQVLSTAWRPPVANGYAVGILIRNELYLKPVDAVVQLRPSMQHLKHRTAAMDEEVVKKEKSAKQVKKQGKPPVAVTEQNTDATPEEQWIPLKYHGETSPLSYRYMENMVARQDCHIQFSMNQSDYIDSLCPATSGKPRPKGSSLSALLKLPLEERFKRHLVEGPTANRYTALKHIAPDASDEDIFKVLKEHAVLVQGWWVAKPKLKFSTAGGKDLLLRNYALLQLSRNPIFQEGKLPRQTGLSELVKVVLDEYAARRESFRDWKFRECPDESFIKNYPDIVKDQKENWDRVEPEIMARFNPRNLKTNIGDRRPLVSNSTNAVAPKTATVPPSKPVIQDETREVLPKALQKLFHAYKVCSINQIRQRLRDMATAASQETRKSPREVKDAVAAADAPLEELQRILTQIAVNIHGSFVLKSSPDHPQYDELRKIVIDLFLADGPGGKLKKAKISAAVKEQLKRDMTNNEYQKVLSELCVSQSTGWVLKSGDSPT